MRKKLKNLLVLFIMFVCSLLLLVSCKDPEATLDKIKILSTSTHKQVYELGEIFDPTGIQLQAVYSNGATVTVTLSSSNLNDATFSSSGWNQRYEFVTTGAININLFYGGKTTSFTVTVNEPTIIPPDDNTSNEKYLIDISIGRLPYNTTYNIGDVFDPSGLILNLIYSDTSFESIVYSNNTTSFESTGWNEKFEFLYSGEITITVFFEEFSTNFTITVNDSASGGELLDVTVKTLPIKIDYVEGDVFDPTGLVLTLIYSDSTRDVMFDSKGNDGALTWGELPTEVGQNYFTLYYAGFEVYIEINIVELYSISNGILTIYKNTPKYDTEFDKYMEENDGNFTYGDSIFDLMGKYGKITPWYEKRDSITKIVIQEGVTSIGDYSFQYLENVTDVELPSTLKSIGEWVFEDCFSLTNVNIPEGINEIGRYAFHNCAGIESITIKGNNLVISSYAFYNCNNLKSVILEGITSVGYWAFASTSLTEVVIPEGVTYIGDNAFPVSIERATLPSTLTQLGYEALGGWKTDSYSDRRQVEVHFNGNIEQWCAIEVDISNCDDYEPETIAGMACMGSLYIDGGQITDELVIPEGVEYIGINAFGLTSLQKVYLPSTLGYIDYSAFRFADNITEVYFNGTFSQWIAVYSVDNWSSPTWNGAKVFYKDENGEWKQLADKIVITEDVGASAFKGNTEITEVIIEEGVTFIGDYAFDGCKNLKKVTLPSTLTYIGEKAFYNCKSLAEITIPGSVKEMGVSCFSFCTGLKTITIEDGVEVLGDSLFWTTDEMEELIIPASVTKIYQDAFYDQGRDNKNPLNIYYGGDLIDWLNISYCDNETAYTNPNPHRNLMEILKKAKGELYINGKAVSEGLVIPAGVTKIPGYAFYGVPIKSLTLPEGLVSIGTNAFGYAEITTLTIPEGMTEINLDYCKKLSTINLPQSLDECKFVLSNCESITNLAVPEGVVYINLQGCKLLETLSLPSTLVEANNFNICESLKSIVFPKSLKKFYARFFRCNSLESITFEDPSGWGNFYNGELVEIVDFSDPVANVILLSETYSDDVFKKE